MENKTTKITYLNVIMTRTKRKKIRIKIRNASKSLINLSEEKKEEKKRG